MPPADSLAPPALTPPLKLLLFAVALLGISSALATPAIGDTELPATKSDDAETHELQPPEPASEEAVQADESSEPSNSAINRTLDVSHLYVSRSVDQLAIWMDRFLGGQSVDYAANETVGRLRYSNFWEERDNHTDSVRFRLRLNLPNTEERLNLIINSELDEEDVLNEDGIREGRDDESASGEVGLQLEAIERSRFKLRYRVGLKSGARLRTGVAAYYKKPIRSDYLLQVRKEIYWIDQFGFGSRLSTEFDRRLTDTRILRLDSRFDFNEVDPGVPWSQRLSVNRALSNSRIISTYLLAFGETRPDHYVEAYGPGLLYRQTLGRPWFFIEIEPRFLFQKDDFEASRKKTASIALRFELVLDEQRSVYWH